MTSTILSSYLLTVFKQHAAEHQLTRLLPETKSTFYSYFPHNISFRINSSEWEITVPFGLCLPCLTSIKWRSETLSIGVNPLYSYGSRRLNPRDFSRAVLLSVCARLGMGDSVMDGSRQIHSSNELMNKYI